MSNGGSAKKWGRLPTHQRGSVEWKDKGAGKPAPFMQNLPHHMDRPEPPKEVIDHLNRGVGAMFSTNFPMGPSNQNGGKLPQLEFQFFEGVPIKPGSVFIYAGIVRVEERTGGGRIVTVPRHTFIADGGRYVVPDMSQLKPIK